MPPIAHWASDTCPAKPVSTTIDAMKTPAANEMYMAVAQSLSSQNRVMARTTPPPTRMPGQLITPVPSLGSTSLTWLRSGKARPRTTSTSRMTRNGTAWVAPVKRAQVEEVLHLELVVRHLGFAHADHEAADERERERLEATEQRGRQRRDRHDQREDRRGETSERRDEDAGEAGQAAADRPRDHREALG